MYARLNVRAAQQQLLDGFSKDRVQRFKHRRLQFRPAQVMRHAIERPAPATATAAARKRGATGETSGAAKGDRQQCCRLAAKTLAWVSNFF